jgi:hypothetical protein
VTPLTDRDLDALRRAVEWGKGYQRREPQIIVFPTPMPDEGTPEWIELATGLAATAQFFTLGLKPWQTEPLYVHDDGVIDDTGWGRRSDEVALRRRMLALGISIYEPDVPAALAQQPEPVAFRAKRTSNGRRCL